MTRHQVAAACAAIVFWLVVVVAVYGLWMLWPPVVYVLGGALGGAVAVWICLMIGFARSFG